MARDNWKGVPIEVYYDAHHPWNVDTMLRSAVRAESLARETTSLVSAAIVALLYFAHYGTMPVHTWRDLLAVFAQAVSLDLGIDTVLHTLKGLGK